MNGKITCIPKTCFKINACMKCVHVYVYLNAGRHEGAHSSVDTWKSEANLGYLSLSLPALFFLRPGLSLNLDLAVRGRPRSSKT